MDISPDKQNIDRVFSNTVYHIDFYQRDYRWTEEPVLRLLSDIFYHFNERYPKHKDLDPSPETVVTADLGAFRIELGHLTRQPLKAPEHDLLARAELRPLQQFCVGHEGYAQPRLRRQRVNALRDRRRPTLAQINQHVRVEQVAHSASHS